MSIEVAKNPSLLGVDIKYRKNGRYSKPHLATTATFRPPGARKDIVLELPKGRKSKAAVEAAVLAVIEQRVRQREARRIEREQREREAKPKATAREISKLQFPKAKLKKTEIQTRSRKLETHVTIIGYNYTFAKKIPFGPSNYEEVIEFLREFGKKVAVAIFKRNRAWGQYMQFKVFGSGFYFRPGRVNKEGKPKEDLIGFSMDREEVFTAKDVAEYIDMVMDNMIVKFRGAGRGVHMRGGYFQRKVNRNEYFITGIRIERVKT